MKNSNSEIGFYVDTLIVETILSDDVLSKKGQSGSLISSLTDKVKNYISNQIDPNNKMGSVLKIIAPGAISMAFSAMGLGWLGILIGLAMKVFNIDISGIFSSIYDKIKGALGGNQLMTSSQVDNIVHSAVEEHTPPTTEEEADQTTELLGTKSFSEQLREAKLLKLAMIEYDQIICGIKKKALPNFLSMFGSKKAKTAGLLSKVLSWIFKVIIASTGLMVAGDVVNKFLGRPNALDDTIQQGKPVNVTPQSSIPAVTSTQTKFKINPNYKNETKNVGNSNWSENISNDEPSIEAMLIMFAKQVYQGLNGLEPLIRTSPGFQVVKDKIVFYNHSAEGDPIVFIPKYFTSKKQIVDYFIDDVAEKAQ